MTLLRPILNAVILAAYLVRLTLFAVTRVLGSIPGGVVVFLGTVTLIESHREPPMFFYVGFLTVCFSRLLYPRLKPRSRPRLLQAPAPPPAPPPSASTAKGRSDDPSEATVIGRLDPKLRDLLRPKSGGTAS